MLLQPLIENAVVHGVAAKPGDGWVRIEAHVEGQRLRLVVSDSGEGFVEPKRNGIGLANTRERLRTLYGAAHQFTMTNDGGARVEIALPLRKSS
jgi:sensor histidine kinase YesM